MTQAESEVITEEAVEAARNAIMDLLTTKVPAQKPTIAELEMMLQSDPGSATMALNGEISTRRQVTTNAETVARAALTAATPHLTRVQGAELDTALAILARTYTNDDDVSGYTVEGPIRDFYVGGRHTQFEVLRSWEMVRRHLHMPTEPLPPPPKEIG